MTRSVLVAGGAGYVGAHTCKSLARAGFLPVVLDNLSTGHREFVRWGPLVQADLRDTATVADTIRRHACVAVLHFAAFAYVGESVSDPAKYYDNNVAGTLSLLAGMRTAGCDALVFSSTCAVYGQPAQVPIVEVTPPDPINPYGASKLMVERILSDFRPAYGLRSVALRYFNACGADPDNEIGELRDPETHLIPRAMMALQGHIDDFAVFGTDFDTPDGTAIRDYVHVADLADAHVARAATIAGRLARRRVQPRHRARLFCKGGIAGDRAGGGRTPAGHDGPTEIWRSCCADRRSDARTQHVRFRAGTLGSSDHRSNRLGLASSGASASECAGTQQDVVWRQ